MGTVPPKPEGYFTRFWGRWGQPRLHLRAEYDAVRELYDEAAALAAAGNESEAAARRAEAHECFVDTRSLMRTEVLALCRESYLATGQTLPSTIVPPPDAEAAAADGRRAVLRVLDGFGAPIAGWSTADSLPAPGRAGGPTETHTEYWRHAGTVRSLFV